MSNKYSELSDFEINKLVAEQLGLETGWQSGSKVGIADGSFCGGYVDYCNNDADCMPIAWENKIGTEHKADGDWIAAITGERDAFGVPVRWAHWSESDNPRRAICECFLLMIDSNQNR